MNEYSVDQLTIFRSGQYRHCDVRFAGHNERKEASAEALMLNILRFKSLGTFCVVIRSNGALQQR